MKRSIRQVGLLVDVTRCTGCSVCVDACAAANGLDKPTHQRQVAPDGLSADRWLALVQSPEGSFVRKSCRHCVHPACVSACPVGAMAQTAEGVVLYDADKCMGCRYCMMACPFGIPRYEWNSAAPRIQKCMLCYDRLKAGQLPACVEACPQSALAFGERSDLLQLAHAQLEEHPDRYLPQVFGESEVGGTALLYISGVPLDFLAFNGDPGNVPYPELTWNWLRKVPAVALGAGALMAGLFWIIERRMQAAASQGLAPSEQRGEK